MEFQHEEGMIVYRNENRELLAKITYRYESADCIAVEHTIVDESLRGQGVAKKLLDTLVSFARAENLKIRPLCSYVAAAFAKDETYRDVAV